MQDYISNINSKTIEKILFHIKSDKSANTVPQPLFVVGSLGSGKSTLLNILISKLKENGYEEHLQYFSGKQFFSSNDIIKAIEGEDYDGSHRPSPPEQSEGKRRIVLIDDIDFYFNRSQFDDQYLLRNYLNDESAPLLIATLSGINNALTDYRAPFFEGVRTIYIPTLSHLNPLLKSTKKMKRIMNLLAYLPPVIRSVNIASDVVNLSDNEENDLKKLIAMFSHAYRNKFESLPVYAQKILIALANSPDPLSLSQIREATGEPAGNLSPYLAQLVQTYDIRKTETEKRGAPYEICDKLFKAWLLETV